MLGAPGVLSSGGIVLTSVRPWQEGRTSRTNLTPRDSLVLGTPRENTCGVQVCLDPRDHLAALDPRENLAARASQQQL